jgi:hypothetical protein
MTRTRHLAAALALAMAIAVPAAANPDFEPDLRTEEVWFSCDGGATPEWTVNTLLDDIHPTWSTRPPAGSVTAGNGCGSGNPSPVRGIRPETPFDLSFAGTYRGNLDSLTVSMHNIVLGTAQAGNPVALDMRIVVGNRSLFGTEEVTNAAGDTFEEPAVRRIVVTPQATGATGAPKLLEFTVTDIGLINEADLRNHRVVVTFETAFTNVSRQNAWVWGATEVPSGLTFNPDPDEHAEVVVSLAEED